MFVVVVSHSVKDDAISSEMLNAEMLKVLFMRKKNVLPNNYRKWTFQDYWNTYYFTQI